MKKYLLLTCLFVCACIISSCSVCRTITTSQSHVKNGDTIAVLTTKTQEVIKTTTDIPLSSFKP